MAQKHKAPVSERALMARLRRELAKRGEALRSCRADTQFHAELGQHYTIDVRRGVVVQRHVDIEALATELGVLRPFETLRRLTS